ncbi:MAG: hypothetical protein AMXMBFR58_25850 [Phycisphaerae bacterium]
MALQDTLPSQHPLLRPAEPTRSEDPIPASTPVIPPTWLGPVNGAPRPDQVVVTSDGSRAYATVKAEVVDVGALANAIFRPAVWSVVGLLSLVALVWIVRRAGRRRNPAARYCARCNYDLTGLLGNPNPPVTCPECGVDLKKRGPVPGASFARRVLAPALLLGLVLAAGGMCEWLVKRNPGGPFPAGRWGSAQLLRTAAALDLELKAPILADGERLVEIDPATGTIARTIRTRSSATGALSLDRAETAVFQGGVITLELVRLHDGDVLSAFVPDHPLAAPTVIGVGTDQQTVYVSASELDRYGTARLFAWDLAAGTLARIADGRDGEFVRRSRRQPGFVFVPGGPPRFLGHESQVSDSDPLVMVDEHGVERSRLATHRTGLLACRPVCSPDGTKVLVAIDGSSVLSRLDVTQEGTSEDVLVGEIVGFDFAAQPGGWLVIVPRMHDLAVLDMKTMTWVAKLALPPDGRVATSVAFSADGKTVLAVLQGDGVAGPFWEMGAWKLPEFK